MKPRLAGICALLITMQFAHARLFAQSAAPVRDDKAVAAIRQAISRMGAVTREPLHLIIRGYIERSKNDAESNKSEAANVIVDGMIARLENQTNEPSHTSEEDHRSPHELNGTSHELNYVPLNLLLFEASDATTSLDYLGKKIVSGTEYESVRSYKVEVGHVTTRLWLFSAASGLPYETQVCPLAASKYSCSTSLVWKYSLYKPFGPYSLPSQVSLMIGDHPKETFSVTQVEVSRGN